MHEHTPVILSASYNLIPDCLNISGFHLKDFPEAFSRGILWCVLRCGSSPEENGEEEEMCVCVLVTTLNAFEQDKRFISHETPLVRRLALFIQGHVGIQEVVMEDFEGEQRSRRREQPCEWLH